MDLVVGPDRVSVCRLASTARWPQPGPGAALFSATLTPDELSVVCPEGDEPEGSRIEGGWRSLSVVGPLDFSLVGVLTSLTAPLSEAGIGVFVVSTFTTDLLLVKDVDLDAAARALTGAGHRVSPL